MTTAENMVQEEFFPKGPPVVFAHDLEGMLPFPEQASEKLRNMLSGILALGDRAGPVSLSG